MPLTETKRRDARTITILGPVPPPFGGVSIHVFRVTARLAMERLSTIVLANSRSRPVGGFDAYLGNSVPAHYWAVLGRARGVLHVHHAISVLTLSAILAARRRSLSTVITVHGDPVDVITRRRGFDALLRASLRRANCVIAVNEKLRGIIERITPRTRVETIAAFVPPTEEELSLVSARLRKWLESGSAQGPLIAQIAYRALDVSPGRDNVRDVYGLKLLADTMDLIAPETQFRLALFIAQDPRTQDEHDLVDSVVARIKNRRGASFQLFVGEYAPPALSRAALLIRPTFADGDSVAIREALAMGVRVIASDVVQRPEGVTLFPTGDATALAIAIREQISRNDRPLSSGPIDSNFESLMHVYEDLGLERVE